MSIFRTYLNLATLVFALTLPCVVEAQVITPDGAGPVQFLQSENNASSRRIQAEPQPDESEKEELTVLHFTGDPSVQFEPGDAVTIENEVTVSASPDSANSPVPAVLEISYNLTKTPAYHHSSGYSFQRDGIPNLKQRQKIRAMPIEMRPNRPLHFYGNAVRRANFR